MTCRPIRAAFGASVLALGLLAPLSARADFFDDARRTFQTDIPHFFQDDIPCAFGGKPTSHTRTSCKSSGAPAKHGNDQHPGAEPAGKAGTAPASPAAPAQ